MTVKVDEPQEGPDFSDIMRYWPATDSGNLNWVHSHLSLRKDEPQIFHLQLFKEAFLWFEVQVVGAKDFKDMLHDLAMFFKGLSEDKDVIHEHTTTPSSMSSLKMLFIIVWKVAGLFVRPKNMTRGSYRPQLVQKAAFHSSPSFMRTLLYPQQTSSFEKYLAFPLAILFIMSGTRGRG